MRAENPDNPTGLLALANEYKKAGRYEDEGTTKQHTRQIRFRTRLTEEALEIELV